MVKEEANFCTVTDALRELKYEDRRGFTFIHENTASFYSFAELYERVCRIAVGLKAAGFNKGARVGLILPVAEEFVFAFYAALMVGVIPVPIYPPIKRDKKYYYELLGHIKAAAALNAIITSNALKSYIKISPSFSVVTFQELSVGSGEFIEPSITPESIALIQFTSGSISSPKGVVLTHKNCVD